MSGQKDAKRENAGQTEKEFVEKLVKLNRTAKVDAHSLFLH